MPPKLTALDFWLRIDFGDCWVWTGAQHNAGYGAFGHRGLAHRLTWEYFNGPIPTDKELDHLCRVRNCVNPAHLEFVTCRENLLRGNGFSGRNARKTHCPQGHAYDKVYGQGRSCRTCNNARALRYYHQKKQNQLGGTPNS